MAHYSEHVTEVQKPHCLSVNMTSEGMADGSQATPSWQRDVKRAPRRACLLVYMYI